MRSKVIVETRIVARTNYPDALEFPYYGEIKVKKIFNLPTSYFLRKEGSFSFNEGHWFIGIKGTHEECQKFIETNLKKIPSFLREWESLFPYEDKQAVYEIDSDSIFEISESVEVGDEQD